jgi:C_GCAxxG_C_C family probable redox protein
MARDEFFKSSVNCAQTFFQAFGELNEEAIRSVLPLGWALGGGLAGKRQVCGALLGSLMVLGAELRFKRGLTSAQVTEVLQKFVEDFSERNQGLNCRDIAGPELSSEAVEKKCRPAVYATALEVERILQKYLPQPASGENAK